MCYYISPRKCVHKYSNISIYINLELSESVFFCSVICIRISCLLLVHLPDCVIPGVPHYYFINPHCQCYFNASVSVFQCQIVMCVFHSFQRFFCLTSRFDPFCVHQLLILDCIFCSILTSSFLTLLYFSTFDFGFSLFCRLDWLSVCWKTDPVSWHSLFLWFACTANQRFSDLHQ